MKRWLVIVCLMGLVACSQTLQPFAQPIAPDVVPPTAYVGPALTYYEFVETGYPFGRVDDEEWQARLGASPYPTPPEWTEGSRVATSHMPRLLKLPEK
jgi:hypothetical protein